MSCYALLCHSQLVGIDIVHTLPYTVVPPPPTHQLPPSCFCLDVTVILGPVLLKLGT